MKSATHLRWVILALVFVASAINFADRQIIGILKPLLEKDLGWSPGDYGHVVASFQLATAASLIAAGWVVDRLGIRLGYAWGVAIWSLAAVVHGFARTLGQFSVARAVLGVSESVNTPAAIKTIATWFGPKDRSLALGIVNMAPNIGSISVPLIVGPLAAVVGWRASFILVGSIGFVWLLVWLAFGRRVEPSEAEAEADAPAEGPPVPWLSLLKDRRTAAIAGAKFLSDQCWVFLLFWAPDFFNKVFHLSVAQFAVPLALVYGLAATGSFVGGSTSSLLVTAGLKPTLARKLVMLGAALLVLPIPLVLHVDSYWTAALILGVALAGHQAFSTNVFALTTDLFPTKVVGSVIGIGATAGTLGGMAILEFAGWTLDHHGGYAPMFAICSVAYLLAVTWVHFLVPRQDPA